MILKIGMFEEILDVMQVQQLLRSEGSTKRRRGEEAVFEKGTRVVPIAYSFDHDIGFNICVSCLPA